MRVLFALFVLFAASAFAQTRAQTIIPRNGFRDAIVVRVQQIDPSVRIARQGDLSFTIGPAQALVSLDGAYQQYAAAPATLGLIMEEVARDAIATSRRAPRPQPQARLPQPQQAPPPQMRAPEPPQRAPMPQQARMPQQPQRQAPQFPSPLEAPPAPVADAIGDTLTEVQQRTPAENARLASRLRPRRALTNMDPAPLSRPFLGDLVEILVDDNGPISAERLEEMSVTPDEAWTRARRNARAGRFAASPLERYGAVVRLTPGVGLLLDPSTCTAADSGNRLFLVLGADALATADRRTSGAEADFFRLLRDVTPTAYSTTPVTCRAGVWEIARQSR